MGNCGTVIDKDGNELSDGIYYIIQLWSPAILSISTRSLEREVLEEYYFSS
jgi:hypothetical protein